MLESLDDTTKISDILGHLPELKTVTAWFSF